MTIELTIPILLTGLVVFAARVCDVALGTIRTISIVQGRTKTAFILGFVEISIWLCVIATVLADVQEHPLLGVFYALGYATGNVAGIKLERRMAYGHLILRVITRTHGQTMADALRDHDYLVTTFEGRGGRGPVTELYIVCRRKDFTKVMALVHEYDPEAFHVTEQAGNVRKVLRPTMQQPTGWRAVFKRK